MAKIMQEDREISDGVNLFISILVRYPEIGTISFAPESNLLKMTFMLADIPSPDEFSALKNIILDSIEAYHCLETIKSARTDIELSQFDQVAILNIFRDVHTLSKNEIALIIALLRDKCKDRLVIDSNDSMLEEDLLLQEELIDNMLESVKNNHSGHNLIGIREDGRVLVFNK